MFNCKGDNFDFIPFISLTCELSAERYLGDFERGFIANLKCTIIIVSAHAHCMVYYFQHRFLAFESLISSAEVENAMISDYIVVCSKFSGILFCVSFFFFIFFFFVQYRSNSF